MMWLIAFGIFWLACALISAGIWFADFQGEFPTIAKSQRRAHLGDGWLFGLVFGPVGLITIFFTSGFAQHGWRLK